MNKRFLNDNKMTIGIVAGALALGGAAYYFIRKAIGRNETPAQTYQRKHHLTNAFSKAKQRALANQGNGLS